MKHPKSFNITMSLVANCTILLSACSEIIDIYIHANTQAIARRLIF